MIHEHPFQLNHSYLSHLIESCFEAHDFIENPGLDDIYTQIDWVKEFIMEKIVTR